MVLMGVIWNIRFLSGVILVRVFQHLITHGATWSDAKGNSVALGTNRVWGTGFHFINNFTISASLGLGVWAWVLTPFSIFSSKLEGV